MTSLQAACVFYLFGVILLMTAGQLLKKELAGDSGGDNEDNFSAA